MSSMRDDLHAITTDREAAPARRKPRPSYPLGWEPRVTVGSDSGEAVSATFTAENKDERDLLEGWLLDPDDWRIVPGTLLVNRWMGHPKDGEDIWLYQYKAKVVRRSSEKHADVDELFKLVKSHKPFKKPTGDYAFVITPSDWQIGKGENGGTPATVERILNSFDEIEDRIKTLNKLYGIGEIYVVGMGDLVEKCANNYANQAFTTDLNEREQARVARRLLLDLVKRVARYGEHIVISSVGGNHGENRNGSSKKFTDDGDNLDVGLFETVYEALGMNEEAYGHVHFYLPDDELCVALDIAGTNVAFTHGHLGKKGNNPQAKQFNWWMGQAFGNHEAVDAEILVTAHYHHFAACEQYGRLWLQCPAQDGGSKWYTDSTGAHAKAGTLTFLVGPEGAREIQVV